MQLPDQKVRIYFFPCDEIAIHSLTRFGKFLYFFFPGHRKKKIQRKSFKKFFHFFAKSLQNNSYKTQENSVGKFCVVFLRITVKKELQRKYCKKFLYFLFFRVTGKQKLYSSKKLCRNILYFFRSHR